ncbi:MAG: hypothetical protein MZV63_43680 [Marinilabiliales bacterium]|nr:hypothetical protein [Marinilabiliales bacterium]
MLTLILSQADLEKELYVVTGGVAFFGLLQILAGALKSAGKAGNGLNSILTDLKNMPSTMGQLAVVQFFTWFALFSLWIYTTSAVTSQVYGTSDTTSLAYNKGANWVGVLFGVYNGFSALVAFLLPVLAKLPSRKLTHTIMSLDRRPQPYVDKPDTSARACWSFPCLASDLPGQASSQCHMPS